MTCWIHDAPDDEQMLIRLFDFQMQVILYSQIITIVIVVVAVLPIV